MPENCGPCRISREMISDEHLCPIHGDDSVKEQGYAWKLTNRDRVVPPVVYYTSDKAAALAYLMGGGEITIISLEE